MGKGRVIFFISIMFTGILLAMLFYIYKPKPMLDSSFAPMFQLFGHVTKGLSRALTQVIPVSSIDEKKYGEAIKMQCDAHADLKSKEHIYLNKLMAGITSFKKKPFDYKVYVHDSSNPNAFALPGGVIFVTQGLLNTLDSESELVSILAHEMGHVELSHCMDLVRFQLLTKKIKSESLGKLVDFAMSLLLQHSFSKTQEDDADTYAFEVLKSSKYDPSGEGKAFEIFIEFAEKNGYEERQKAHVIRDYFSSHPPLTLRAQKFSEKARVWWKDNPKEKRYVGKRNIKERDSETYEEEWKIYENI